MTAIARNVAPISATCSSKPSAAAEPRLRNNSTVEKLVIDWTAVQAVAEGVAAAGVIASLVYLAVQVRQNTRAVRAGTYDAMVRSSGDSLLPMIQDGDLARSFEWIASDWSDSRITPEQRTRVLFLLTQLFRNWETPSINPDRVHSSPGCRMRGRPQCIRTITNPESRNGGAFDTWPTHSSFNRSWSNHGHRRDYHEIDSSRLIRMCTIHHLSEAIPSDITGGRSGVPVRTRRYKSGR
jgi:hypothetical protein